MNSFVSIIYRLQYPLVFTSYELLVQNKLFQNQVALHFSFVNTLSWSSNLSSKCHLACNTCNKDYYSTIRRF